MSGWITLSVVKGPFKGDEYHFNERTLCTVGRSPDCYLRFPTNAHHMSVSRHHCLIDIEPPYIAVRDLGSRNGTFVNGIGIGHRPEAEIPGEAIWLDLPQWELKERDEIRIADTVLRVHIEEPAHQSDDPPAAEMQRAHGVESALGIGSGI